MNNDYSNFGAYLTHRVNAVLNSTSTEDYKYEPTTLNAANDATRYIPFYDYIVPLDGLKDQTLYRTTV